ncbi:hypothetical protein B0H14DRAFT_3878081 [Mycena olivaceomarginata]|nr:hypothetical protein B0H14DRAFT_3878081 [Mycena olivaceomarginata]
MVLLLNETPASDDLELQSVSESYSGLKLEELLDEMQVLPFIQDDPCGEFGGVQGRIRDPTIGKSSSRIASSLESHAQYPVNGVAVECWKVLRTSQTPKNIGPQDLSLFPGMPIDILLEVLGHLHPIDLRHVARVNNAFRALLHSSSPEGPVACRLCWARAPSPVPARDLWPPVGEAALWPPGECGAGDTNPDYRLWRRLCTDCLNSKLTTGVPPYPSSHEIHDLVVKTFREDGRLSNADAEVGRLWPADGAAVAREYARLADRRKANAVDSTGTEAETDTLAADETNPETDDALAAFISARKTEVAEITQRADEAEYWSDRVHDAGVDLWEARLRRVVTSARKRLIEEGHDARDAHSTDLDQLTQLENFPRLTSRRWHKARPYVLPLVAASRTSRLEYERALLIVNRTAAVAKAALEVLRTAPPTSWAYAPPVYVIEAIPELQALVQDAGDAELAEDNARLAEALLGLPAFVQAWRAEKRALLASLLPEADPEPESVTGACSSATTSASDLKVDVVERVDRATSVYTCLGSWVGGMSVTSGRALIGWTDAGAHLRCRSLKSFWDRRPHYAPEGAAAAEALVRLVGLDPERASAAEMDAVCGGEVPGWGGGGRAGGAGAGMGKADPDKRFLCLLCPVDVYRRVHGRRAMRWRECVQHTIERTRMSGGDAAHRGVAPAWALLTDAAAEDLRRREAPDPVFEAAAWMCTLCTEHYDGRKTRAAVVEHVRVQHQIQEPLEGTHVMFFAGSERKPRVPALLSQETHALELRCNLCAQGKLRSLRDIKRHVADKHNVRVPSEADWTRVELILRTTPMPGGDTDADADSNSGTTGA